MNICMYFNEITEIIKIENMLLVIVFYICFMWWLLIQEHDVLFYITRIVNKRMIYDTKWFLWMKLDLN